MHRLGAAVASYISDSADMNSESQIHKHTAPELVHQLSLIKSHLLLIYSSILSLAIVAAKDAGIPMENIVLVDNPPDAPFVTLE